MSSTAPAIHGWTAKPRDIEVLLAGKKNLKEPEVVKVEDVKMPDSELVKEVMKYAVRELRAETFNHSMRVFFYGVAIKTQQFPSWQINPETYLLTCLLHDIGSSDKNLSATLMSFEFYGGFLAHNLLHSTHHAPISQAEAVTEAIIRHQDLGTTGTITELGLLIQLATVFDNMGGHKEMVDKDTIEDVVKHYPRKGWSRCFSETIRKENGLKPWAHTTKLGEEDFPNGVVGNQLMAPYDG